MDITLKGVADGWIQCYRVRGGGDGVRNKFPPGFRTLQNPGNTLITI